MKVATPKRGEQVEEVHAGCTLRSDETVLVVNAHLLRWRRVRAGLARDRTQRSQRRVLWSGARGREPNGTPVPYETKRLESK